jgi:osmoprotectant transport system ATP-binding protein
LEQYGTPEDLLIRPKNDFIKSFVGADRALKRLNLLTVAEAMLRNPIHCRESDSVASLQDYMTREQLSYLLVVDGDNHLRGYVSLLDMMHFNGLAGEIVRPMTLTVPPDWNLKDALSKMLHYDLGILSVVDEDNHLLGVLNSRTLFSTVGETYDGKGGHWGKIESGGRVR